MESTHPKKYRHRISRSRPIVQALPKQEARRLESLYEESPAVNTIEWNSIHNNVDDEIINVQNFNTQLTEFQKQQEKNKNNRIIINVCGNRYETYRTTLERYPDTLLGNEKRRKHYYDKNRNEYFFDRHHACFEAILYYYQSNGRLRRPEYVSLDIFIEEVTFFQLGEQALNQIRKDENIKEVKKVLLPKHPTRRYLWIIMEYPDYSKIAKIVNILSLAIIIISTITLSIETLPQYVDLDTLNCDKHDNITVTTIDVNNEMNQNSSQPSYICSSYFTSPFFIIQAICAGLFTVEFFVRILTTPSLLNFIKTVMNWIDLMAIIPFYITLAIRLAGQHNEMNSRTYINLRFLTILRLARIFKFYRVFKSMKSFRVLATAITESLLDFLIMIIILSIFGFLFGTVAYYAENNLNGQQFDSIFKATYWGIITITSVGYGDITPITAIGRIIACLCALCGAATIGMLVSVLVDRYQRIYARTLFINDEPIHIDDYSDDENDDADSKNVNRHSLASINSRIADNNARVNENVINSESNIVETLQTSDSPLDEENPMERRNKNNEIHFIIGYADNENQEKSRNLVEEINSIVAKKRASGDNISLRIISNESIRQSFSSSLQFQAMPPSDEDSGDEDSTKITKECRRKRNVFKSVRLAASKNDDYLNNSEKNA